MLDAMNLAILIGAGLIAVSVFTSLISFRVGAPLLLVFLAVGLLAGEDGIGGINFDDAASAYFIGSIALAIILFDSGYETRLQTIRVAAWPSLVLASVGVLLTTGLVGAATHWLFGLPWLESLLMGAIVSSTDAAAVFFLLRVGGIALRDRVRSTLEIESGSNDPMAIFLTLSLVELIAQGASLEEVSWDLAQAFAMQIGLGLVLGVLGGLLIIRIVNRVTLDPGLYPVLVMALALVLFAATSMAGGSGFLALYIAGLLAGNAPLRMAATLRRFQGGMTWLCQIGMFLTLGLLATPSTFVEVAAPALALALFLVFIGRPLAIWLCLLPFGFSRNENAFIAWVGLRGAVSILLGILPIAYGLENGDILFNTAFIVVLVSLVLQGWTLKRAARRLGLIIPPRIGPVDRFDLELPGGAQHDLVTYRIAEGSPVASGHRIPRWARPSLILREGQSMRFHTSGRLQPGDQVLIFATHDQVRLLDRLFAAPTPMAADDREFYGDFVISGDAPLGRVAASYGFEAASGDEEFTVCDLLKRTFGKVETGDRLPYGPVDFIVRSVGEDGEVAEIGLAVEPSRTQRRQFPLFQTRRDIQDWLRRRRERRSMASKATELPAKGAEEDMAPERTVAREGS
jgi:potassium/hydrogen antiporter